MSRRFPAPWASRAIAGGYQVVDANGVVVAWVYAREDLARLTGGDDYLTNDELRRIASAIARVPELHAKQKLG